MSRRFDIALLGIWLLAFWAFLLTLALGIGTLYLLCGIATVWLLASFVLLVRMVSL